MNVAEARELRADAMRDADDGSLPEAEEKLDTLIATLRTADERVALVAALTDRATVRRYANRWDEALEDLHDAETIARALPALLRLAQLAPILHLRAKLLARRADLAADDEESKALVLRREAADIGAELRAQGWVPWAADELESDLAFGAGDWDRASVAALRVAEVVRKEGWERPEATLRLRAGLALLERHDLDNAELHIRFAYDFFQRRGPPAELASAGLALARVARERGEFEDAWRLADQALLDVEAQVRRFRVPSEQQLFLADKARYYTTAFEIALAAPGSESLVRAWSIAERAKSFYLCQLLANAEVPLFDGVDPADVVRLGELERDFDACEMKLGRLGSAPTPQGEELEELRAKLSADRQRQLARMMKANRRWAALRVPQPVDVRAILATLDPAWAPLSYYWGRCDKAGRRLHIFWSDPNGPRRTEVSWSHEELVFLRAACKRLRGSPTVDPFGPVLPQVLTDKLLPLAIREAIVSGRRLLISPHEILRALPLHALLLGDEEVVIDRWPVQYLPTLALLPLRREALRPKDVLALGCVLDSFGGGLLRDVIGEIDDIQSSWKSHARSTRSAMLPQDGATLAEVGLQLDQWKDFGVVHLACHGVFPEGRPFDAALRLGDTQVGSSDIFAARLNCSTVSLSACSLGRSMDADLAANATVDEWAGLHIPLIYAGAETLVLSLWDADSGTARLFMAAMHRALGDDAPPAIAVSEAVRAVRTRPPVAWANWFISGLPD